MVKRTHTARKGKGFADFTAIPGLNALKDFGKMFGGKIKRKRKNRNLIKKIRLLQGKGLKKKSIHKRAIPGPLIEDEKKYEHFTPVTTQDQRNQAIKQLTQMYYAGQITLQQYATRLQNLGDTYTTALFAQFHKKKSGKGIRRGRGFMDVVSGFGNAMSNYKPIDQRIAESASNGINKLLNNPGKLLTTANTLYNLFK